MSQLRFTHYLSLGLLSAVMIVQPAPDAIHQLVYAASNQGQRGTNLPVLIAPINVPIYTGGTSLTMALPQLSATAVYVMDRQSGAILYQKNADQPRYPASTEKMMTALVSRHEYGLNDVFTVGEEAFSAGSTVGLKIGEQLTVEQLLYALLIPSGNDAAFVLANNHPGKYAGFVTEMNNMARQLHLTHTFFRNPSGLDVSDQASSSRDLAILANEVMKDSVLRTIVGTKTTTIHDVSNTIHHQLVSTNELLGVEDGVVGIKTGTTDFAGENLVVEVDRNGHQIIIVVLGSRDRFNEMKEIIDWIFANYTWRAVQ